MDDKTNRKIFGTVCVVEQYRRAVDEGLTVPEKYCIGLVPRAMRRSILDLGIGCGRTTKPLSEMFARYIGIDYSSEMIRAARSVCPGTDLRIMDVRRLNLEAPVDCVMFSFNGIDCIPYSDRYLVLNGIRDRLTPGGYYIYSTHNLHYKRAGLWMSKLLARELFWPRNHRCLPKLFNRMKNFRMQFIDHRRGFAYVNDPASSFRLRLTYVNIEKECEVLQRHGFSVLVTIGNTKSISGYDADDNWVYIVTKAS